MRVSNPHGAKKIRILSRCLNRPTDRSTGIQRTQVDGSPSILLREYPATGLLHFRLDGATLSCSFIGEENHTTSLGREPRLARAHEKIDKTAQICCTSALCPYAPVSTLCGICSVCCMRCICRRFRITRKASWDASNKNAVEQTVTCC